MSNIIKREFNEIKIAFEGKEQVNLTDLWKASGSPSNKETWRWLNDSSTADFVLEIAKTFKPNSVGGLKTKPYGRENIKELSVWVDEVIKCASVGGLIQKKRGNSGGTWAHWQIGLAYAKYLSPQLHMFVNQCFMDYVEEANNPSLKMERAIEGYRRKGKSDAWIDTRFKSKLVNQKRNQLLATRQGGEGNIFAMCSNATNKAILGMSATEFKQVKQLTKSASVRDNLSMRQLLEIMLTEEVASERIVESNIYGNRECERAHEIIGSRIHNAVMQRGA